MDSYTITIAPNDDSGNSTTLIVDTSADEVRITDVRLHAAGGLTGGQMPTIDFGLLLNAVAGSSAPTAIEATPTRVSDPEPAPAQAEETPAPEPVAAVAEVEPAPAVTPKPRRAKRTPARAAAAAPVVAEAPAPEAAPRSTARRRPAAKGVKAGAEKAPAKRATARKKAVAEPAVVEVAVVEAGANGRAYRRMPDDFAAVYRQASSPAAIADHYSVPRHTAQGWIRRQKATDAAAS